MGILDIEETDRKDLRSWYERHAAPYRVLSADIDVLHVLNTINNSEYVVRINMKDHHFTAGLLVIGSLMPWKGQWYWSGQQKFFEKSSKKLIDDLKKNMVR